MKKYIYILLSLCFFVATSDVYADDSWLEAFIRLNKAERFAFGKIGYAAVTSQGEKDLRTLIEGECPTVTLKILYATGTLQAKCYALVAFQKLSKIEFEALLKEMEDEDAEVTTVSGCEILRGPVIQLLKEIKKGAYAKYLEEKYIKQNPD